MSKILLVLVSLVALYLLGAGIKFYKTVQVSKELIRSTAVYEKVSEDDSRPVLVLGDSTAVGVGANTREETTAGQVSAYLEATSVENYAKSGAFVENLSEQIAQAKFNQYELILIQIGANDIVRLHSPEKTAALLVQTLKTLPQAKRVIVLSAGDVGGAPLFPIFLRPLYTNRTLAYHAAFEKSVSSTGATYINLYTSPSRKVINDDPDVYLAADGFHPSSAGYKLWFDEIRAVV